MTAANELDQTIADLEPMIVRGQFNKAIRELTAAFEKRLEEGNLGEARFLIGMTSRATKGRNRRLL
jgi:hypothetical protein